MREGVLLLELIHKEEKKEEAALLHRFIKMIIPEGRVNIQFIKSKRALLHAIRRPDLRFVHISCHGGEDKKGPYIRIPKGEKIRPLDLEKDSLKRRFVIISGCILGKVKFAIPFVEQTNAEILIAPLKDMLFEDAALFWVNFYHRVFSRKPTLKKSPRAIRSAAIAAYPKYRVKGAPYIYHNKRY